MTIGATHTTPVIQVAGRTWAARILVWPLCVLIMVVHLALGHDDFPITARTYAGLIGCLAALCVAYAPIRVVPALAIGMSYFYAALGAPVFLRGVTFSVFGPIRLPPHALESATLAALVFAVTVVITSTVVDRATRRAAWSVAGWLEGGDVYASRHTAVARTFALISFGLSTLIAMHVRFGGLHQPVNLLASPIIAITFLFWDAEQTKTPVARQLFWGYVGLQCMLGMLSGMLGNVLLPAIVAAALLWARRGHLPAGLMAASAAAFIILNPAKATYRELTWFKPEVTLVDRVTGWGDALWLTYVSDQTASGRMAASSGFEGNVRMAASRLNTLGQVAQIFDWVPERVRHAGPDHWLMLPQLLIPRAVWPDKPVQEIIFNRDYTFQFRLQAPSKAGSTSIALPSVGDGYWRLGWPGVLIEAMFMGLLIGWAQAIGRGGVSRIASRTSLLLSVSLMQIKTDLHTFGSFNGALQQLAVALGIAWAAKWAADLLMDSPAALVPRKDVGGA